MPETKPCPTCGGNAYSTPMMSGPVWCAVPGRSEVARLQGELGNKEEYVEILENRVKTIQLSYHNLEKLWTYEENKNKDLEVQLTEHRQAIKDLYKVSLDESMSCDHALQATDITVKKLEARLKEAERKNDLYKVALETLKHRHFPNVRPPDELDRWSNGTPCPGAYNSVWKESREAFALLDEKYLQEKLK